MLRWLILIYWKKTNKNSIFSGQIQNQNLTVTRTGGSYFQSTQDAYAKGHNSTYSTERGYCTPCRVPEEIKHADTKINAKQTLYQQFQSLWGWTQEKKRCEVVKRNGKFPLFLLINNLCNIISMQQGYPLFFIINL